MAGETRGQQNAAPRREAYAGNHPRHI